jgi:hypothetical protein
LGGHAAALTHLPLSIILKELSMLAAPTACDGIVDMKAFDQLTDIIIAATNNDDNDKTNNSSCQYSCSKTTTADSNYK